MPGSAQSTIPIVDDAPENLTVLGELPQPHDRERAATSGEKSLRIASGAQRHRDSL